MAPSAQAAAPTISSTTVQPLAAGAALDVTGSGYTPESSAYFYIDDDDTGGYFASLLTNATGDTAGTIVLPVALANGPHVLDSCKPTFSDPQCPVGNVARLALQIGPAPTIDSTTPQPALAGGSLAVTASGFQPDRDIGFFVENDFANQLLVAHTDALGTVAGAVSLPATLGEGTYELEACRLNSTPTPVCFAGDAGSHIARRSISIAAPLPPPPPPPTVPAPTVPPATVPSVTTPSVTAPPVTVPPLIAAVRTNTTLPTRVPATTAAATTTTTAVPAVAVTTPTSTPSSLPRVAVGPVADTPPVLGIYEPAAHARTVVELQIAVFAILGIIGLAPAGVAGGAIVAARRSGSVTSAKVKHNRSSNEDNGGVGDRSRSWRVPATLTLDRLSVALPARVAPTSPLLARVLTDGSYLRAIFGSGSVVLPVMGIALGIAAVLNVGGAAAPPGLAFMILLPVLGVLDALAGLIAIAVFTAGVTLSGGIVGADSVRTMLGLAALSFAAALIASAARPLRRPPSADAMERWDHLADFVIASLIGAWAVQKMVGALPGLAGVDLPIASHANVIALSVLAAMILRMLAETITSNWYPRRLAEVNVAGLPLPGTRQRLAAIGLRTAVFLFVAVAFIGVRWQWAVGGVLFAVPQVVAIYEDRFPRSEWLYRRMPRGIVKTVLMLIVGAFYASLVFGAGGKKEDIIANAFVLLSLPGLVLSGLDLIGRDGEKRALGWIDRVAGLGVLALGIWLVQFR
ncbi:MAG: hypothetical protein QOF21_147 [Actinomycetota bacterium]|jgi:hypothetical protein